jgi:hypothetical protein
MRKLNLSATVTVRDNESTKNKVRCPKVTVCSILLGDEVVAGATLGGVYTPEQVLADFKRNHRADVYRKSPVGYGVVKSAKLVS